MNDTPVDIPDMKPVAPQMSTPPTVTLVAAGGCGINMIRQVTTANPFGDVSQHIESLRRFDTSYSNVRGGEDVIVVGDGDGSGKVRTEHAEKIQKKLTSLTDEELGLSDINVVVFSLAGGSGSVLGPVLIREIKRRGGQAVCFVVADTMSERDTTNTLRTLQTLQSISTNDGIYLPTSVFSNAAVGRPVVDQTLPHRLTQFIWAMTLPAVEIDRNDRRNFLNGMKTNDAHAGVRLLHVIGGEAGDDDADLKTGEVWECTPDDIYDSTLSLGIQPKQAGHLPVFVSHQALARAAYQGVFSDMISMPIYALVAAGNDGIVSLMKDINATQARFAAQAKNTESVIGMDGADADSNGMVF